MHLVLIGAPGAGKGTQAASLARELQLAHIASGDMFRDAMARGTPRGLAAKAFVERGELVPDEITVGMVTDRLSRDDAKRGSILDGFPRNIAQADALDHALAVSGSKVDQALYLAVSREELLRRLAGRWLCRTCGASYHEVFSPPKQPGRCDQCDGDLYQREDDTRAIAERRLEVYFRETEPLIDFYRSHGILDEVNGEGTIADVQDGMLDAVRRRNGAI
jgi:adenylate kinase